jgi:cytochrome c
VIDRDRLGEEENMAWTLVVSLATVFTSAALAVGALPERAATPDGRPLFAQHCAACHSIARGDEETGPSLWRVVGRRAGSEPGFDYSPALRASGIIWDQAQLNRYLAAPQKTVPGSRMPVSVQDAQEREAIVRYIVSLK